MEAKWKERDRVSEGKNWLEEKLKSGEIMEMKPGKYKYFARS